MKYPSSQAYDFSTIEQNVNKNVVDIKAEDVTEAEKSSAERTKELFLAKIRKQKQEMESRQAGFDVEAERKRPIVESEEVFERENLGRGRGKDKVPPSKTKAGQYKNANKEYYTGNKKKK